MHSDPLEHLAAMNEILKDFRSTEVSEFRDELKPVRKITRLAESVYEALDEDLISTGWNERFCNAVDNLYATLQAFLKSPKNAGSATALESHREELVDVVNEVVAITKLTPFSPQIAEHEAEIEELREELARLMTKATDEAEKAETTLQVLEAKANEIQAELLDLKSEVGATVEELASETTQNIAKIDEHFAEVSQAIKSEIDDIAARFQEAEKARVEQFRKLLSDTEERGNTELRKILDELRTNGTTLFDKFKNDLETSLEDANSKHQQIKKIYGLVGKDSTSGSYSRVARNEGMQAAAYRILAAISVVVAIGWAYFSYQSYSNTYNSDFEMMHLVHSMLRSAPVSGMILVAFFFLSRQSAQHAARAQAHKLKEQQVAAVDPMLERLSTDDAREARKLYIETILKEELATNVTKAGRRKENSEEAILNIVERILDRVSERFP